MTETRRQGVEDWVEDFVDEDTGEVVSIERNEVIIEPPKLFWKIIIWNKLLNRCQVYHPAQGRHEHQRLPRSFTITLQKDTSNSERGRRDISPRRS